MRSYKRWHWVWVKGEVCRECGKRIKSIGVQKGDNIVCPVCYEKIKVKTYLEGMRRYRRLIHANRV